jgi:hypothetical protein
MSRKKYEGVTMSEENKKSYADERSERSEMEKYIGDNMSFDSFCRMGKTGDYKLVFDTPTKHVVVHFNAATKQIKVKEYQA